MFDFGGLTNFFYDFFLDFFNLEDLKVDTLQSSWPVLNAFSALEAVIVL